MFRHIVFGASKFVAVAASFVMVLSLSTPGLSQQSKVPSTKQSQNSKKAPAKADDSNINAQFADPDVKAFVKRFESESREVSSRRNEIVKALGLKPGMTVADFGAGTGLFTGLIAAEVGEGGLVYAVDISPAFLKHIEDESKRLKQKQVRTIKATQESTGLTPDSLNLVFLCDVYHHLERPMNSLRSIHDALKANGHLVVIDFDRVKGKSSEFVLKHVRADKAQFIKEIQSAGFEMVRDPIALVLNENFFLRFQKVDRPKVAPDRPESD